VQQTYVVQPHDTLYSIAWRHDVDYRDLAKWNKIGSDFKLSVGQVLLLQPGGAAPAGRSAAPRTPAAVPAPAATNRVPSESTPRVGKPIPLDGAAVSESEPGSGAPRVPEAAAAAPAAAAGAADFASAPAAATTASVGSAKWTWPTDRLSAPRPVPGGGILLLGRLGQDVRAAGSGRVVYTGSGLRGYGNLIIIKHGDSLLSSYAHNRELLVREGQEVSMGQVIAHMGMGPHQVCALYFEIRVNGKPTDPLKYLASVR
jgi:lipoprotein NlpD